MRPRSSTNSRERLSGRLAATSPGDPAIRECLARSHAGLGELCLNADQTKEAIGHLKEVVALAEESAQANGDQDLARAMLLEAYFRLGRAYGFDRALEEGEVWFRKMQSLAERWIADDPANVLARDQLSTAHRKIADMRKLAGDDVAARSEYVKAVDLGRELLLAEPGNADVKLHLALALDDQGMTLARLGLLEEAAPLERQAEQLFSQLVQDDAEDVDNRLRLHQTQFHRGRVEMDLLHTEAAQSQARRALDGLTALAREGKLDGRPRDRAQLLPRFEAEVAANDAVATISGDLKGFSSTDRPELYRLMRICAGLLANAGCLDDLAATAEALSRWMRRIARTFINSAVRWHVARAD